MLYFYDGSTWDLKLCLFTGMFCWFGPPNVSLWLWNYKHVLWCETVSPVYVLIKMWINKKTRVVDNDMYWVYWVLQVQTGTWNGDFPVWFPVFMNGASSRLHHQGVETHAGRHASLQTLSLPSRSIKATFRAEQLAFHVWEKWSSSCSLPMCGRWGGGTADRDLNPRVEAECRLPSAVLLSFIFSRSLKPSTTSASVRSTLDGRFRLIGLRVSPPNSIKGKGTAAFQMPLTSGERDNP